jgi:hypothetical protein
MDQITDEERRRIAELVAEGAPPWKLYQEIHRSRHAIRRAVVALYRPARREPQRSPLRLSLARAGGDFPWPGGRAVGAGDRPRRGACPVGGVPGGGGERRAGAVPGVRCRPVGGAAAAAAEAGQAGRVPAAARGGGGQAGGCAGRPEQIAAWLALAYPGEPEMRVPARPSTCRCLCRPGALCARSCSAACGPGGPAAARGG